jgi:hypothetical protein
MSSSRARRLRLPGSFAGSFAVAFLVAALVAGCGWLGRELQPGSSSTAR